MPVSCALSSHKSGQVGQDSDQVDIGSSGEAILNTELDNGRKSLGWVFVCLLGFALFCFALLELYL